VVNGRIGNSVSLTKRNLILFGLVILALAIRIAVVWALGDAPVKDALQYHSIALNLISGHGYAIHPDLPTSARPPVYPLFLTLIYGLFGSDYHYALHVQAVLNALLVFPIFWFAKRLSGSDVTGFVAAGLFSVHTSFEIVSRLYAENLIIIFGVGFVCCLYFMMLQQRKSLLLALLAGLFSGLMGLTKTEYALLGVATVLFALLWPAARVYWRAWLTLAVVSLLIVGGWQIRNAVIVQPGQKSFIKETIVFANCPALAGAGWWSVTDMAKLEQQRTICHQLFDDLPQDELVVKVRDLWLEEPLTMLKLVASRVLLLWVPPPVGSTALAGVSALLAWVALLGQYAMVSVALAGMILGFALRKEMFPFLLLAVYMTVVYGLLHSIRRYGYPFVPELCLMFAYGLWVLRERWKKR